MERTRATTTREPNGGIQLKGDELSKILAKKGHTSLRAQARYLNVGVATLQSAIQGGPVGLVLIRAWRRKLRQVRWERIFQDEVQG